jgi:hypothetical protein
VFWIAPFSQRRSRFEKHRKLRGEVAAWVVDRNKNQAKADWQFTTDDA